MDTEVLAIELLWEAALQGCIFLFLLPASFVDPDCIFSSEPAFRHRVPEKHVFAGYLQGDRSKDVMPDNP